MDKEPVISDYMKEQNRQFHIDCPNYGSNSGKWANGVKALINKYGIRDVLDYGCGKAKLSKSLPEWIFYNYDPGMPEMDQEPTPADLVVCSHILEHVDPDLLLNVISDLFENTKRLLWITLKTGESGKILPDGQDSNLIQKSINWWVELLYEGLADNWMMRVISRPNFLRGMIRTAPVNQEELTCLFIKKENS